MGGGCTTAATRRGAIHVTAYLCDRRQTCGDRGLRLLAGLGSYPSIRPSIHLSIHPRGGRGLLGAPAMDDINPAGETGKSSGDETLTALHHRCT